MSDLSKWLRRDLERAFDYDEVAAYFAWMDEKYQEHVVQERYNAEMRSKNANP